MYLFIYILYNIYAFVDGTTLLSCPIMGVLIRGIESGFILESMLVNPPKPFILSI
jgi:hypothetical protein